MKVSVGMMLLSVIVFDEAVVLDEYMISTGCVDDGELFGDVFICSEVDGMETSVYVICSGL